MPRPVAAPDSTAELLNRFGRQYPTTGRAAVGILAAATAPFAGPLAGPAVAAVVSAAFIGWNVVYLRVMWRAARTWCWALDVVIVCGLCLSRPLLVDPALQVASLGWVSPVASFTVVAVQFLLPLGRAAAVAAAICTSFVVGGMLSPEISLLQALGAGGAWMAVEGVLARLLWWLVRRGGREADVVLRRQFELERAAATAAARRADQRAHWATLHDTSASTLLMVGLGQVRGDEPWLRGQVDRDIAALQRRLDGSAEADVVERLRAVAERAHVAVEVDGPDTLPLPSEVAVAFAGAVAEALENVHRHAGVPGATVALRRDGERVVVTVADRGRGFTPDAVGSGRYGLAWFIRERMAAVGGRAAVESARGRGTVVRLECPGG